MKQAAILLLLAACGRTGLDGTSPSPGEDLDYHALPECSEPVWVDGGLAYVGEFSDPDFELHPGLEPFSGNVPSMLFDVQGFYLERDEASVACYEACVAENLCPPRTYEPPDTTFPASVSVEGAEAFCHFRGGRLPTLAELSRASHPDQIAVGDSELVADFLACAGTGLYGEGFSEPGCEWWIARSPINDLPAQPVGSAPKDIGRYGHRDLFGAQLEVTSSRGVPFDREYRPFSPDPGSFGTGPVALFSPISQLRDARDHGRYNTTHQLLALPYVVGKWGALFGVRCAFEGVNRQ